MRTISLDAVRHLKQSGNWSVPASVSTPCPHCGEHVIFTTDEDNSDPKHERAFISTGVCPACKKRVTFVFLASTEMTRTAPLKAKTILMHPAPESWHPTIEFTDNIPPTLRRAYESTVDSFNTKNYVATAVCCRRTLEGIFKYLVSDDKKKQSLAKLIEDVKKNADLAAPLTKLSHAIREGGNLGAHFDEELEPSREMASHMVDLVEYLLSYLYVLPRKIDGLHDVLGTKASQSEVASQPNTDSPT